MTSFLFPVGVDTFERFAGGMNSGGRWPDAWLVGKLW